MRKLKQTLCLITLLLATLLFSCVQVENKASESEAKVEATAVEEQDSSKENLVALGEELTSLEGEVYTLSHYKLPKVGDELHGFKVNAIYDFDERNAKVVLFEHKKTGSKAFLISNDDEDKAVTFAFNTLTFDDKGVPHVFEHACLGGSEKYPNSNLFDEAVSKTYNTFMNATTMQHTTAYPISSLSDPQLFALYKFYLDGAFNPNILRDQKNLDKEAYRYSLNDKNDEITLNGVVYSEMSGNEGNINRVAYRNSLKGMFEGSYMGVNTGGKTSEIPKMTHEDLIEFHKKYYHPSNMVTMLYGDLDYKKYLKYLDEEYLNKFDKKEIDKSDPNYKKKDSFHIDSFDFPVASDSDIEGKTLISYNLICEGMTQYENGLFQIILTALNNSDGPLKTRLKEKLPEARCSVEDGLCYPRPFLSLTFSNVDKEDGIVIKSIVEESFEDIKKNGISKDALESIINYIEWNRETKKDSHGFANESLDLCARAFASNGENILGYFQYSKAMSELEAAYANGDVTKLVDKYLNYSENASLTITSPKRGLLEENSKNLKDELKKKKEAMTDAEIQELINKTKEYDKWVENEAKYSIINILRVATLSELDEYKAKCYAYEEKTEGISFIRSDIEGFKYNIFDILFDASNLSMQDALKLQFTSNLLFELPSKNYSGQKLKAEFDKYAPTNYAGMHVVKYFNGGYKPYFSFSATSLDRNLDKVFELLNELMNNIIFDDVEIVKNVALSELRTYKNYATSNPTYLASMLVDVKTDKDEIYNYNLGGVNYLNFLKEVVSMSDAELKEFIKECETLYKNVYNRQGMVVQVVGNFGTIKDIKNRVIDMAYDFKNQKVVPNADIATKSELKNRIAVVTDGTVQYNYMAIPLKDDNMKYTAKYAVLDKIVDASVLYQEFRVKRSAYGAYSETSRLNANVYTYRDPNLRESYEVFGTVPQLIKKIKLSEEELDDYKLSAYSKFAYPLTKIQAATTAVSEVLTRTDDTRSNRYIRYMKEIKSMKLEDLNELASIYDKMVKGGVKVTVGGREAIEMNADLFDDIIYDYIK